MTATSFRCASNAVWNIPLQIRSDCLQWLKPCRKLIIDCKDDWAYMCNYFRDSTVTQLDFTPSRCCSCCPVKADLHHLPRGRDHWEAARGCHAQFYGAALMGQEPMLLVEYCEGGDLRLALNLDNDCNKVRIRVRVGCSGHSHDRKVAGAMSLPLSLARKWREQISVTAVLMQS